MRKNNGLPAKRQHATATLEPPPEVYYAFGILCGALTHAGVQWQRWTDEQFGEFLRRFNERGQAILKRRLSPQKARRLFPRIVAEAAASVN